MSKGWHEAADKGQGSALGACEKGSTLVGYRKNPASTASEAVLLLSPREEKFRFGCGRKRSMDYQLRPAQSSLLHSR
jgi:hypothetical protein